MTAITIGINTKPVFASGTHGGLCGGGGAGNSNPTAEPLNTKVTSARVNVVANVKTLFSAFLSSWYLSFRYERRPTLRKGFEGAPVRSLLPNQ